VSIEGTVYWYELDGHFHVFSGLFQPFLNPQVVSFLRFIKGFIYRHKERCPENEYFLDYVRYSFLMKLRRNLPKNVLDKSWPTPPAALAEVGGVHMFLDCCVSYLYFLFRIYLKFNLELSQNKFVQMHELNTGKHLL